MIEKIIEKYSDTVVNRPITCLAIVVLVTGFLVSGASKVTVEQQSTEDFLPDSFESIKAFETIQKEFGTAEATTYTVLIESEPSYGNSNEIRDMRDPEALKYIQLIESEMKSMDRVNTVESPVDLFEEVPASKGEVDKTLEQLGKQRWSQYISDDYSAAKITIKATSLSEEQKIDLANDIRYNIESNDKPAGLELTYTGQIYIDQAFQNQSNRTNQLTTTVAFLLVLVVVILLFRSVFYGLNSLQTLVFGIAAGFGTFGWLGYNLSPATSGAISIGVGIAIDFGIQPVSRYIEERKTEENGMEKSLAKTIKGVARPMTLGVIAAVMGFSALSFGRITFLSSLGVMLSLTTIMAYIAAFTVIPPTLIIHDRYLKEKIPDLKQYYSKVKFK